MEELQDAHTDSVTHNREEIANKTEGAFGLPNPKIVLLSYTVKKHLRQLDSKSLLPVNPSSTDLEFLFFIREYLVQSNRINEFDVFVIERNDLDVHESRLLVHRGRHVLCVPGKRTGYASSMSPSTRMERQLGNSSYYCPFELDHVVTSSTEVPTFYIDADRDMIFEYSDDDPVSPNHYGAYRVLVDLFEKGRVQTNPYFLFKQACARKYTFSSSKNMAYYLFQDTSLVVPGIITSSAHRGLQALNKFKQVVLKTQDGTGGRGVSFCEVQGGNHGSDTEQSLFKQKFEQLLEHQMKEDKILGLENRGIIIQKFLPDIKIHGDTRVHVINGKICLLAQQRIPRGDSKLANVSAGGTFRTVVLDDAQVKATTHMAKLIEKYEPAIKSSHIGIDLLRGVLSDTDNTFYPVVSEINTWGIGFLAETVDFFLSHDSNPRTQQIYATYCNQIAKHKGSEAGMYILQTENILYEVVGRYLAGNHR